MGASFVTGACSRRSAPQTRPRTAPSTIEPSRCDTASTIEVLGTSNIFGAGIADPPAPAGGGGGTAPPCVSFPSTVTSILIRATGTVSFSQGGNDDVHFHRCVGGPPGAFAPPPGPDGMATWSCAASPEATSFPPDPSSITAVGSISGISSADGGGYLVGVFLADSVAAGPPPATPGLHRGSQLRLAFTRAGTALLHRRWPYCHR
jgi:hypothetical protein